MTDEHGAPTGELRELSAQDLVLRAAPRLRWPELRARYVEQLQRLNALGLTGAHVMDGEPATYDLLRDLEGTEELTMRLRVPLWQTPHMTDEEMEAQLPLRDARGRLWRGGVVKFFADGVIDSGTAWLEQPDTHGEGLTPFWPEPERMAHWIERFAHAGFQVATHTIGDAAVRFTLDAYIDAGAAPGVRHRLEHLETLPDDLVTEIAAAGVTASMQPVHLAAVKSEGNWSERLGPERAARAFRMRDLLDAGAVLALGSDWPVADADPRLGLATARLRRLPSTPEEEAVRPEQALTAHEALAGYTLAPALAAGEDGRLRAHPRRHARRPDRARRRSRWTRPPRTCRTSRSGSPSSAGASCITGTSIAGFQLIKPHPHPADELRHPALLGLLERLAQPGRARGRGRRGRSARDGVGSAWSARSRTAIAGRRSLVHSVSRAVPERLAAADAARRAAREPRHPDRAAGDRARRRCRPRRGSRSPSLCWMTPSITRAGAHDRLDDAPQLGVGSSRPSAGRGRASRSRRSARRAARPACAQRRLPVAAGRGDDRDPSHQA